MTAKFPKLFLKIFKWFFKFAIFRVGVIFRVLKKTRTKKLVKNKTRVFQQKKLKTRRVSTRLNPGYFLMINFAKKIKFRILKHLC